MRPTSLSVIFWPATWLMNRLKYGAKFIFIGIALLLPLGYTTYLQFNAATKSLVFNHKEHIGVVYIDAAKELLEAVQRRRILAVALLAGSRDVEAQLGTVTAEIENISRRVDEADAAYGVELKSDKKWQEIKSDWTNLKGQSFTEPTVADAAHAALTAKIGDLILNYAGNYSNLILDPDLDSYYLMDAYIIKMPALGQAISSLTTRAMLPAPGAEQDRFVTLAGTYTALTTTANDLVAINLTTTFKETKDPGVKVALEERGNSARTALVGFGEFVKAEYLLAATAPTAPTEAGAAAPAPAPAPAPRVSNRQLIDRAMAALDENFALYRAITPQLDGLIQTRVTAYAGDRRSGLIASLVAAAVLFYLFTGFFLAVRTSVAALAGATTRMIAGTKETFALTSRDELGQIAEAYNKINAALLEARTLREQVERDNIELQGNIMELLQVVSDASDGNLTVRASIGTGSLGNVADAFNQLLESLGHLMQEIQTQIARTNATVNDIRSASQKMTSGATNQAREVLAATELVEQMSTQIASVSDIAETAATAARRTKDSAEEGSEAVQNVVTGMQSLRVNVQAGAKKMKNLGERSMEITTIVSTIQRISEQTNMLALNAAIEAARAGEHGRGFTVVADEVRKLAERTALATEEIGKLVKTIHAETTETVNAIEKQTHVVEEEATVVGSAGDSLNKILEVSTESFDLVNNIRRTAAEQVAGTKKVVLTMEQISSIAQSTQLGAQGNLTTIEQLIAQSGKLADAVGRFRV